MGGVNSYLSRGKKKKTLYGHPSRDYPFSINGNFSSSSHADCSSSAGDEMCVDLTIDRKYPPLELSGRRRRRCGCCRRVLAPVPRRFKKGNFPSEKPKKKTKKTQQNSLEKKSVYTHKF